MYFNHDYFIKFKRYRGQLEISSIWGDRRNNRIDWCRIMWFAPINICFDFYFVYWTSRYYNM